MRRRHLIAGAATLFLAPDGQADDADVTIDNFAFTPALLTVPAGTTVTWINRDDIPHTVTDAAPEKRFRSPALDTDDRFRARFDTPGEYAYYCALHPHMQGKVIVT